MSKFVVVDEAPANLNSGEIVIEQPKFLKEIAEAEKYSSKLGGKRVTTLNHLKSIAENIRIAYDPEGFDAITAIPYSKYEGIQYDNPEDLANKVVLKMLNKYKPEIFAKAIDKQIKTRPQNTSLIYFVGNEDSVQPFLNNGLDRGEASVVTKTVKEADKAE